MRAAVQKPGRTGKMVGGTVSHFIGGQPAGTTVHLIIDVNGYFE